MPCTACKLTLCLHTLALQVEKDTIIIKQGQDARRIYVIISGECAVVMRVDSKAAVGIEGSAQDGSLCIQVTPSTSMLA